MEVDRVKLALVSAILTRVWCKETASPVCKADWSEQNPSLGQGAVTALIIDEMMGGYIMRTVVGNYGSHYYNVLPDGNVCDLTKGQFPPGVIVPEGQIVDRDTVFCSQRAKAARTSERYALLLNRFMEIFFSEKDI